MNATHLTRCKSLASALNSPRTPITEWMAAATEAGLLMRELGEQGAAPQGEPVAWQVRNELSLGVPDHRAGLGQWRPCSSDEYALWLREPGIGVRALFASPPAREPQEPPLSLNDRYWVENRARIIDAIEKAGFWLSKTL